MELEWNAGCLESGSCSGERKPERAGTPFWGPVETNESVLGPNNHRDLDISLNVSEAGPPALCTGSHGT